MSAEARLVDTSFSRYDGPRAGRLAAVWSLARWSALRALGARRGWKAKLIPITLALLAYAPALVVLGLRALFAGSSVTADVADAFPYSDYLSTAAIVVLVFSVVVTPELLCPDRRDRTLSLYFSTAVGPLDYLAGKVLAALLPLLLVTVAPVLVLYAGNVLFALHPLGYLQAHWADVPRIVGAGAIAAAFYAMAGLAIASLTARRAFAVGGYLAFLAMPTVIGGILAHALDVRSLRLLAVAAAPVKAGQGLFPGYTDEGSLGPWTWGAVVAIVVCASISILALRYDREEG